MIQETDLSISPATLDMFASLGSSFIISRKSDFEQVVLEFPFRIDMFDCSLTDFELWLVVRFWILNTLLDLKYNHEISWS